jgi:hypothetical protein
MYNNAIMPSIAVPSAGILLMVLVIAIPQRFSLWSVLFALYSLLVLALTV